MCDDEVPLKRADLEPRAALKRAELESDGVVLHPVRAKGRALCKSFWGKAWMKSLAACEVYGLRLAPGRMYLRYGCVLDVVVSPGEIKGRVMGEYLEEVCLSVAPANDEQLAGWRESCAGRIGSWLDLLNGKFSDELMAFLSDEDEGIFPHPDEWHVECSCTDWADVCPHAAAVMYAFGVLLDESPELLFTLRGVCREDLLPEGPGVCGPRAPELAEGSLGDIFGIELDS